jgi:hypothetical protein
MNEEKSELYLRQKLNGFIAKITLEDDKDYWLIGRARNCDLIIPSPLKAISRVQCTLVRSEALRKYFKIKNNRDSCFLLLDGYFGNPRSSNGLFNTNNERIYNLFIQSDITILLPENYYLIIKIKITDEQATVH